MKTDHSGKDGGKRASRRLLALKPQSHAHYPMMIRRSSPLVFVTLVISGAFCSQALGFGAFNENDAASSEIAFSDKSPPRDADDLRRLQKRTRMLAPKLASCTVAVRAGAEYGSGVIVSSDGYVLSAAHVTRRPGRRVVIILSDGREIHGQVLGMNPYLDAGLMKIVDPGPWPYVKMATGKSAAPGQWCLATGHPGGFQSDRPSVLRLGRIVASDPSVMQSDCPLEGGDSGGPLFDFQGRVIGIHSRVGIEVSMNLHVPVKWYRDNWDRLLAGQVFGSDHTQAFMGVVGRRGISEARIARIHANSPGELAGLKAGDVITAIDGKPIGTFDQVLSVVQSKQPGDTVSVRIRRGGRRMTLNVRMGAKEK